MKQKILVGLTIVSSLYAMDDVAPSTVTPAGLDSMKVPQLITMGFDDNRYEDGVRWVVDTLLAGKLNGAGVGNKATFDGETIKSSFFVISNADQRESWREAYEYGCEIGNHTVTHEKAMYDESAASHTSELGGCSQYIVNDLGLPPSHIQGFRTPFLAFDPAGKTFAAVKELGMIYDASVENGTQASDILWTRPNYPWTLNHTIGAIASAGSTPGLWQVPHVNFIKNDEQAARQKGFDSGLWPRSPGLNIGGPEVLEYLKGTFDFHYGNRKIKYSWLPDSSVAGNRAPMDIGFHSDYYSVVASDPDNPAHNPDYIGLTSTVFERRKALMDFVDYALSFPDTRFVRMVDIVRWMQNPVELEDLSHNAKYEYDTTLVSPNLLETAGISVAEADGSSITVGTITDGVVPVTTTISDPVDGYVATRNADFIVELGDDLSGIDGFLLKYRSDIPLRITFLQDGLTTGDQSYFFAVPTSSETRTVTIPLNELNVRQPHYHEVATPFDLTKIREIAISPMAIDVEVNGSFTLESLQLFGSEKFGEGVDVETAISIQADRSISISKLGSMSAELQIPQEGVYTVNMYTAAGRQVVSMADQHFSAGANVVQWSNSLSTGMYITHIQGRNVNYSVRQMVQ